MSAGGKTILIVEDDRDLRRLYKTALLTAGYEVKEAADGLSALRAIESNPPDLVVLDLALPMVNVTWCGSRFSLKHTRGTFRL